MIWLIPFTVFFVVQVLKALFVEQAPSSVILTYASVVGLSIAGADLLIEAEPAMIGFMGIGFAGLSVLVHQLYRLLQALGDSARLRVMETQLPRRR